VTNLKIFFRQCMNAFLCCLTFRQCCGAVDPSFSLPEPEPHQSVYNFEFFTVPVLSMWSEPEPHHFSAPEPYQSKHGGATPLLLGQCSILCHYHFPTAVGQGLPRQPGEGGGQQQQQHDGVGRGGSFYHCGEAGRGELTLN
jgi:hypothetical protein